MIDSVFKFTTEHWMANKQTNEIIQALHMARSIKTHSAPALRLHANDLTTSSFHHTHQEAMHFLE